jgi:hypothetical protein
MLVAGFAAAAAPEAGLYWGAGALLAYLIGLTYVAKQETLGQVRNLWPLAFLAVPFLYAHRRSRRAGSRSFSMSASRPGWSTRSAS